MCLAVPAQLTACTASQTATADLHGNRVEVSTMLVPEAVPGDWVLIHAGFAIQRLDRDEARETWSILRDLAESNDPADSAEEGTA